ncbi:MAG TPA: thioredoxin domain-containing protein [Gaiellaceae bacterium]
MNRLAAETSPYLLQHAGNPVEWYPWGGEAFARARDEGRPLLVSVGYSACHWCHVMEHESFEDPATAAVMNEHFVNVKVDREERPDVDAVTMDATVTMTGHGGWPTTVFMTPELQPFYAGTYFPPEPRHGLPSFRQVLGAVAAAWQDRRDDLERQATRLVEAVGESARIRPSSEPLTAALLAEAEQGIARTFEPAFGGFGRAPKFPPPSTLELLLRRGGDVPLRMARATLDGMAAGGMWDVVGGGFHRYSVDDRWLVPHFEKMLYDNALLASTYLHASVVTGDERYRDVVTRTLDYVLRELLLPEGGLASAQDADTDGVEGLTYTWTPGEIEAVLGPHDLSLEPATLEPFEHGRFIVRGEVGAETRRRLLAARQERPQPFRDDKAIASWNGLALAALAEAGRRLDRADWIDAAVRVAEFLLGPLTGGDGRLLRSFRAGRTSGEGYLDDYANVAHGLLELHVATGEPRWLLEARRLALLAVDLFADDEHGGFFLAAPAHEPLLPRTKPLDDNPLPSGNSMLAHVLLRLARIWGDDELERRAATVLRLVAPAVGRAPGAFGWALCALDLYLSAPRELAVLGPVASDVARAALAPFAPSTVVAVGPAEGVPLLEGKGLVDGRPAIYLCERFACRAPVTDPAELAPV